MIHSATRILQDEPKMAVSQKEKTERQKAIKIAIVDIKQAPVVPIKRPKQIQDIKLKKGNMRIQRYIKLKNNVSKIKV